jgi:hypothetical protein
MGHLDGGRERDVRVFIRTFLFFSHHTPKRLCLDQSAEQNPTATLASLHSHILVREDDTHSIEQEGGDALTRAGTMRTSPSRLRSVRACETRSMPRLRA